MDDDACSGILGNPLIAPDFAARRRPFLVESSLRVVVCVYVCDVIFERHLVICQGHKLLTADDWLLLTQHSSSLG